MLDCLRKLKAMRKLLKLLLSLHHRWIPMQLRIFLHFKVCYLHLVGSQECLCNCLLICQLSPRLGGNQGILCHCLPWTHFKYRDLQSNKCGHTFHHPSNKKLFKCSQLIWTLEEVIVVIIVVMMLALMMKIDKFVKLVNLKMITVQESHREKKD